MGVNTATGQYSGNDVKLCRIKPFPDLSTKGT